jgi:hypothetical protein
MQSPFCFEIVSACCRVSGVLYVPTWPSGSQQPADDNSCSSSRAFHVERADASSAAFVQLIRRSGTGAAAGR